MYEINGLRGGLGLSYGKDTSVPRLVSFGEGFKNQAAVRAGSRVVFMFPSRDDVEKHVNGTEYHGKKTWIGTLNYSVDGGPTQTLKFAGPVHGRMGGYQGHEINPVTLTVPEGAKDIKFWVETQGIYGKKWYSDFGRDFHLPVRG